MRGIIVDNFAGGGGASTGIEAALGRAVTIAINHDEEAIRMHEVNHPGTHHIRNNIWQIDPKEVTAGQHVGLAWFSPDCKHFSKAKGGKPREKSIRDLAWVVVLWAQRVKPDVILLENVEEFRTWGPLCDEGKPIKERAGETFDKWRRELRKAGYKIQWKELRACDYGAPTIRKRFFMIARRDGNPIAWPAPTHGKPGSPDVLSGKLLPWRTAAEIIDWSIPCPSIFDRKKPLAEKTLRRIAVGIMKFVINNPSPFIVPICNTNWAGDRFYPGNEPLRTITTAKGGEMAVVAPHITKFREGAIGHAIDEPLHTVTANSYIKRPGGSAPLGVVSAFMQKFAENGRGVDPSEPLHTVMAGAPRHAVVCAHLEQANGGPNNENLAGRAADLPLSTVATSGSQQRLVTSNLVKLRGTCQHGQPTDEPLHTISAGGTHMAEVRAFLLKYYGTDQDPQLVEPLHTVTTKDRYGLVTVTIEGEEYVIVDIGMRMLSPRELFNAQGFPPDYIIDQDVEGRPITKTAQVAKCGNSVCPPMAEALVRAQFPAAAVESGREAA
jgi:DNA (cytosine-5)-methyltransferase 1